VARRPLGAAVWRWAPVAAWMLVISAFSTGWFGGEYTGYVFLPLLRWLFPAATLADLVAMHHVVRKLAHVFEYLVLGVLLYRALDGARGFSTAVAWRALAVAAVWAVLDEAHQLLVAGRTGAVRDALIDVAGAAAGLALLALRARMLTPRAPARP
jgi:VanZ family protein